MSTGQFVSMGGITGNLLMAGVGLRRVLLEAVGIGAFGKTILLYDLWRPLVDRSYNTIKRADICSWGMNTLGKDYGSTHNRLGEGGGAHPSLSLFVWGCRRLMGWEPSHNRLPCG